MPRSGAKVEYPDFQSLFDNEYDGFVNRACKEIIPRLIKPLADICINYAYDELEALVLALDSGIDVNIQFSPSAVGEMSTEKLSSMTSEDVKRYRERKGNYTRENYNYYLPQWFKTAMDNCQVNLPRQLLDKYNYKKGMFFFFGYSEHWTKTYTYLLIEIAGRNYFLRIKSISSCSIQSFKQLNKLYGNGEEYFDSYGGSAMYIGDDTYGIYSMQVLISAVPPPDIPFGELPSDFEILKPRDHR